MKTILAFNDYYNEELAKRSSLAGNGELPREMVSGASVSTSCTALFENLHALPDDPEELRDIISEGSEARLRAYFQRMFDARAAADRDVRLFPGVGRTCRDG